jgi:hypothetical protein
MTAEVVAKALGGRKAGGGWIACCPAHQDRKPSLSITEVKGGKVLVRCHAGCEQEQVISILRSRGLWTLNSPRSHPTQRPNVRHKPDQDDTKRTEVALAIWQATTPAGNTVVESYLASRGLHLPPVSTLRFNSGLKHPSGGIWPVMVALVTNGTDGTPLAIHRTFLARDGQGKAPVEPAKLMLGPCAGGAVRLGPISECIMIGEGIETALSAMQATGQTAWAALSTSGLRSLKLPAEVRDVIVLADGDEPGEAAARAAGLRWKSERRRVRIARPPRGFDFNDVLLSRSPDVGEPA